MCSYSNTYINRVVLACLIIVLTDDAILLPVRSRRRCHSVLDDIVLVRFQQADEFREAPTSRRQRLAQVRRHALGGGEGDGRTRSSRTPRQCRGTPAARE